MAVCKSCNQEIPDDSPFSVAEVEESVGRDYDSLRYVSHGQFKDGLDIRGKKWSLGVMEQTDLPDYEFYASLDVFVLFSVEGPAGTQYFKKTGQYSSYDGYDWDGQLKEVKPTKKTVTVYE